MVERKRAGEYSADAMSIGTGYLRTHRMQSRHLLLALLFAGCRWNPDSGSAWPGCAHPEVKADCHEGWCRIPPGCFILGSPETEFGRGKYSEQQVPVTLTHAFLIQQYQVSRSQWTAIDPEDPSFDTDEVINCLGPDCPVTGVSWFKALDYANNASSSMTLR